MAFPFCKKGTKQIPEIFETLQTGDSQTRSIAPDYGNGSQTSHYLMCVEADGRWTGFTRVNYRADYGHYIGQGVTGVLAEERGRGLGKWLKAGMLRFIKASYPDVEQIKTSYASVNDPMISINKRIGFQPYNHLILYTAMIADIKSVLDVS